MAKKPTINSSLFQPTVPVKAAEEELQPSATATPELDVQQSQVAHKTRVTQSMGSHVEPEKELTHNTSTRIPLDIHQYFEDLAVEHGYSTHSLRIYALSWFVKEHLAGNIALKRDTKIRSKRVLALPKLE